MLKHQKLWIRIGSIIGGGVLLTCVLLLSGPVRGGEEKDFTSKAEQIKEDTASAEMELTQLEEYIESDTNENETTVSEIEETQPTNTEKVKTKEAKTKEVSPPKSIEKTSETVVSMPDDGVEKANYETQENETTASVMPPKINSSQSGSGNGNGSNSGGSGNTIPEVSKTIVNPAKTGIVTVSGIHYAVITFGADAENRSAYTYHLSGQQTSFVTPVNHTGSVIKIELPDDNSRTLELKQAGVTKKTIKLNSFGNSSMIGESIPEESLVLEKEAPFLVLARENIPLEQYLKFITVGNGTIFVKSGNTTVTETSARMIQAVDAVSSATQNIPGEIIGKTIDATIAVSFDLLANHIIANQIGIGDQNTSLFIEKWNQLEPVMAVDESISYYAAFSQIANGLSDDIPSDMLPEYVKYITAGGLYGTKVTFPEGIYDNVMAPVPAAEQTTKGSKAIISLSEKNDTWYKGITEIGLTYSRDTEASYFYQSNHTLSDDGRDIILPRNSDNGLGPMNYADTYTIRIKSFNYEDVTVTLPVVATAPDYTYVWNDVESRLEISTGGALYYRLAVTSLMVGNSMVSAGEYTPEGSFSSKLYIPYRYLDSGENIIAVKAAGYADKRVVVMAEEITRSKSAPEFTMETVLENTKNISLSAEDISIGSEEADWWSELSIEHITCSTNYSNNQVAGVIKNEDSIKNITLTVNSSFSVYYEYTLKISIPGYEIVRLKFQPVSIPPVLESIWQTDNSLNIVYNTGAYNSYFTYVSGIRIDGILLHSSDYRVNSYGIVILADQFVEDSEQFIVELLGGIRYEKKIIEVEKPLS